MLAPARNCVVPAAANHTVFAALPLLRIVKVVSVPSVTAQLAGKTKSASLTRAVGRVLLYAASIPELAQVSYCVIGQTLSATAIGGSMLLIGGLAPILFTVA